MRRRRGCLSSETERLARPLVVQVTGSNSISVAEHEMLLLLALVRNFVPAHAIAAGGLDGWNIADAVQVS